MTPAAGVHAYKEAEEGVGKPVSTANPLLETVPAFPVAVTVIAIATANMHPNSNSAKSYSSRTISSSSYWLWRLPPNVSPQVVRIGPSRRGGGEGAHRYIVDEPHDPQRWAAKPIKTATVVRNGNVAAGLSRSVSIEGGAASSSIVHDHHTFPIRSFPLIAPRLPLQWLHFYRRHPIVCTSKAACLCAGA